MSDWNPIDTAPLDGTAILLWIPPSTIAIGSYDPDRYSRRPRPFWDYRATRPHVCRQAPPTHWMLLPSPPEVQ